MSKFPPLKPREVESILKKMGFLLVRQKGSHKQYAHPDGRFTTIAFHKGYDISPIMVRVIAGDIGVTIDFFYNYC